MKKIWYSITKIEKYGEMATEGVGKALLYLSKLIIFLAIILSIWVTIQTSNNLTKTFEYIKNDFPEFSYKSGELNVESEEPIIIENEQIEGKIVVDTKTNSEETINQYINSINEYGGGIVILKNRVIISNMLMTGSMTYDYKEMLDSLKISEFNKKEVVEYVNSSQMTALYVSLFATLFIYTYVWYLIKSLWYVAIISIFGYLTAWLLGIKMRYAPIFNMSVYASTLSIILNIIYVSINIFIPFTIKYFEMMYIAVATIYLIAAIFIIKSEFIKKQAELMKITEVEATVKKQIEEDSQEEKKKEEKPKEKKEEEKKEGNKKEDNGEEPEGSKA